MPNRLYIRRFLNRPGHHGPAFMLLKVEDTSASDDLDEYPEVDFELADCFARIVLSFDLDSASGRRNSLHKARLLRDGVTAFHDALEAEIALMDEREAARRRARKASVQA